MILFTQLFIGAAMIGVTVFIHAIFLDMVMNSAKTLEKWVQNRLRSFWRPVLSALVVVLVFVSHIVHIWLWAGLYRLLSCQGLPDFGASLYFSTVTYTTLGTSIFTLNDSCEMLSGIEGANGFLLFGWTTAFIFEVVSQLYRGKAKAL